MRNNVYRRITPLSLPGPKLPASRPTMFSSVQLMSGDSPATNVTHLGYCFGATSNPFAYKTHGEKGIAGMVLTPRRQDLAPNKIYYSCTVRLWQTEAYFTPGGEGFHITACAHECKSPRTLLYGGLPSGCPLHENFQTIHGFYQRILMP